MKICIRHLCLLLVLGLLGACSLSEAERRQLLLQTPPWYSEAGIVLTLKTEPMLNAWKGMPNAVSLLIIQARDKQSLTDLIGSEKRIRAVFSGANLPNEFLAIDRFTAQPGQQTTLHLNRAEGTYYVGVIAGYYPVPLEKQMAIVAIPVKVQRDWWDWKVAVDPLRLSLIWGERALLKTEGAENLLLAQPLDEVKGK